MVFVPAATAFVVLLNLAVNGLGLPSSPIPSYAALPNSYEITRQLNAVNATGTFFFNGDNYGCIYSKENVDRVKHVYRHGHQVASHTWAHRDLSTLGWNDIYEEMRRTDEALQRITGALPAFMRPPYGNYNNLVREVSASRHQAIVLWDFDSGDSVGVGPGSQKYRYTQLAQHRPSSVLTLNHEVYASSVHDVLPHAISKLRQAGYRLVSVAECLGRPPYIYVQAPAARDSSWKC
ncbi:chitin deacetylase [Coprinopsis cinerea okayama7|uniref:Chitin deacetylase n=1 Tax=Coprinopsis cinerea (strain Okayama-7 / 130 / ATCC MYA-4618 / FGSC 9003) TaxID=240176 RepID=A8N998_COPC7|nr:chitin deacetylase [Coprinopsis cinerea okayama7\|eukprot:XP_001831426.1 chitin deacetylase [Coprinopsis cinerea okayama7\